MDEIIETISEEKDCQDGKHCETQTIVSEAELNGHLQRGWRVVAALSSGNVVVER